MSIYDSIRFTDPGQAFTQAFEQGQTRRREAETQNALSKYAQNPDDPEALNTLARYNPQAAIALRERQATQQQRGLEQHRAGIEAGGQIIRRIMAENPGMPKQQVYAIARQTAIGARVPGAENTPAEFSEEFFNRLLYMSDPAKQQQGTSMQQNYEFLKGQNPQLADNYLKNQAEGAPLIASNGDGTFTIIPRNMAQGGQQAAPPPPPPGFTIDQGGPTQQASGGFPGH